MNEYMRMDALKPIIIGLLLGLIYFFSGSAEAATQSKNTNLGNSTSTQPSSEPNSTLSTQTHLTSSDISQLFLGSNALLTGYGATTYIDREHTHGEFEAQFNPIFLFRFSDLLLWESEVNLTIGNTGQTDTTLEYASLDWFINDYATLVAGKFLTPIGFFVRNLHPTWINPLPSRPIGFDDDQAVPPEAEIGAQILGVFQITSLMIWHYSIFIANGPQASVDGNAVSEIQSEGINSANKLYGGRIGFLPIPAFEIGVSAAGGKIAFQDSAGAIVETARQYHVIGTDINYYFNALKLRAEFIQQTIPDDANSTSGITQGGKWYAYYTQGSYRFSSPWEVIIRYGYYSPPQADSKQHQTTLGIDYWFMDSAAAKLAYEFNSGQKGAASNANVVLAQLTYGF